MMTVWSKGGQALPLDLPPFEQLGTGSGVLQLLSLTKNTTR